MNLWLNNVNVGTMELKPSTTLGELKYSLIKWLSDEGYRSYSFRLIFNNGDELNPAVFTNDTYDGSDFQAQANLIKGSNLHIIAVKPTQIEKPKKTCVGEDINILYSKIRNDIIYATLDINKLLRYWVDYILDDKEELLEAINAKNGKIDYDDPDVRDYLYNRIEDQNFLILTHVIDS
jgi:hypothetical protein